MITAELTQKINTLSNDEYHMVEVYVNNVLEYSKVNVMSGTVIETELGGDIMSTLQMEFMETIEGLSDDTMRILLEVVKQVVLPLDHKENVYSSSEYKSKPRRIGSLKGQRFISEGHDIDECNDEIAKMFEGEKKKGIGNS